MDERLHNIMVNIYHSAAATAGKYGMKGNLVAGANIAEFREDRFRYDEPGCLITCKTA